MSHPAASTVGQLCSPVFGFKCSAKDQANELIRIALRQQSSWIHLRSAKQNDNPELQALRSRSLAENIKQRLERRLGWNCLVMVDTDEQIWYVNKDQSGLYKPRHEGSLYEIAIAISGCKEAFGGTYWDGDRLYAYEIRVFVFN